MALKIIFNPISGQFDFVNVVEASASETFAFFMGG